MKNNIFEPVFINCMVYRHSIGENGIILKLIDSTEQFHELCVRYDSSEYDFLKEHISADFSSLNGEMMSLGVVDKRIIALASYDRKYYQFLSDFSFARTSVTLCDENARYLEGKYELKIRDVCDFLSLLMRQYHNFNVVMTQIVSVSLKDGGYVVNLDSNDTSYELYLENNTLENASFRRMIAEDCVGNNMTPSFRFYNRYFPLIVIGNDVVGYIDWKNKDAYINDFPFGWKGAEYIDNISETFEEIDDLKQVILNLKPIN